jgi:hypothetical protein
METIWVGKTKNRSQRSSIRSLTHRLLVDVIPVVLLLAAMAYGMAFVSYKMAEPRSVEIQALAEKLG